MMMEDYLVEAKQEYTSYLISVLIPSLSSGFRDIFDQAKKIHNGNSVYKNFQLLLENVPHWNNYMLEKEVADIIRETGCTWLDDLLTAVFVSHSKILASVKVGNYRPKNRKIDLKIPDTPNFVHQCYIQAARDFYKNPMLFVDDPTVMRPDDILKNQQMTQNIVKEAICTTIRKLLPFKDILTQYLALDVSAPIYIGGGGGAAAGEPNTTTTKQPSPPPPPPMLLSLPSPPSPPSPPPPTAHHANNDDHGGDHSGGGDDHDHGGGDDHDHGGDDHSGGGNNGVVMANKKEGKVLDLFDMEIPTPPSTTAAAAAASAILTKEPPSMDSATVQQVVSNIHKELTMAGDDIMTVGMTELQGVLNDGGTIDAKLNKPKPFLPTTFKKQAAGGSKSTTINHNNNNNAPTSSHNVKKIVVKYSGSEAAAAAKKKNKQQPKLPTTLIEDAEEADSTEMAF